jgi:hypothetical protein
VAETLGRVTAIRSLGVLLAAACLMTLAPEAGGHDGLAPPGARHDWLPDEDWIARHWLPFDERSLTARLGIRSRELEAYLYDDHRSLADLAHARGLDVGALRDELVAPWRPIVDTTRYELLRDRTDRVLTQPHLAQHVFFHLFHGSAVAHKPQAAFGLPAETVRQLRLGGLTPVEIAQRGGVSKEALRASMLHFLHLEHDEGILRNVAWPAESHRILLRQTARLDCWLDSPRAGDDPANPYGKARFWHGPHRRGWPRTRRERRRNERLVERLRRSLRRGCWPIPPAWSWRAHGLVAP